MICLLGGNPEDIKYVMEKVEKYFTISTEEVLERHLGVDYKF